MIFFVVILELRHSTNALTKIDDVIGTSSSSSQQSHTASKLSSKDTQHHSHQRGSLSSVSGDRIGQTNRPSSCPPKHTEGIQQQTKGGGHCKSDSKTSNLGSSKKNHSLSSPVVRVERMSPSLMVKKPNSTMGPPGSAASPTTIPVDKRELPSPQQPPPLFFASPTSPCLSLPSPLNPLHNQQSPTISPSPPGSLVTTHPLSFQGIPLSSVATTAQTLQKRLVNNTLCATLSSSSMSLSSESKPKPCRSKSKIPKERKLLPCKGWY